MPHFLPSNNKGPLLLKSNNKTVQKTATKYLPSYYGVAKAPNNSDSLILDLLIVVVRSHKNKCTTRNKDTQSIAANATAKKQNSSDLLIPIMSMETVHCHKTECANPKNNENRQDEIPSHICAIEH